MQKITNILSILRLISGLSYDKVCFTRKTAPDYCCTLEKRAFWWRQRAVSWIFARASPLQRRKIGVLFYANFLHHFLRLCFFYFLHQFFTPFFTPIYFFTLNFTQFLRLFFFYFLHQFFTPFFTPIFFFFYTIFFFFLHQFFFSKNSFFYEKFGVKKVRILA